MFSIKLYNTAHRIYRESMYDICKYDMYDTIACSMVLSNEIGSAYDFTTTNQYVTFRFREATDNL